jgi:arginase
MRVNLIYATWPVTPFGVGWHRFADAMRQAGLGQRLRDAGHDIEEHILTVSGPQAGEFRGAFELGGAVAEHCRQAIAGGAFPVIVCGSCAVAALGAMAGLGGGRQGVVWLDAHADLNTPETTRSGLLDGMALSAALGLCWSEMGRTVSGVQRGADTHAALFGARDIEPAEADLMAREGVALVGDGNEAAQLFSSLDRVYLHLDMDVHDGLAVRVSQYAVPGGPSVDEVGQLLATAAARLPVAALSVTGIDPAAADAQRALDIAADHIRTVCDNLEDAKC